MPFASRFLVDKYNEETIMLNDLTIPEFEAIVASRALCERLIDKRTGNFCKDYSYNRALVAATFAANSVFKDMGVDKDIWCWMRGKRTYIFHVKTNRLLAQLGIDTEEATPYTRKRLRVVVMDRKGFIRQKSIKGLIEYASRIKRGYASQERNNYGNQSQARQRRPHYH